ncbi:MAG: 1,4-alpha-glucan branching protein GlgB [Lachnospiraceae bacterium]|nr:1,4-alpha-glucan branching protein GlgB [Lachnospiraceae bacterium]
MDIYGFYTGRVFDAYEYLGAHLTEGGAVFRTFAPAAAGICVRLEGREIPMNRIGDGNFYEACVPEVKAGDCYEYRIYGRNGQYQDHCDPYGFGMELRPAHRSVVRDLCAYRFKDEAWVRSRDTRMNGPMNIYELHAGSWRKPSQEQEDWYSYGELAELLAPYLKESGYNYVELMPLSEHPCDESWGYQNTGFYAPTSRYGTAAELMEFVDIMHRNGIGVLLDYVPVHFAVDDYALVKYDGTELYEYPHSDVGVSEWGSYNFIHSRGEVRSFLQSAANYWLKEYHFDGLRMDAISRIIYWMGDERRGVNGNAVDFVRVMNRGLKERNPGCILIAEDSTNYPNVTKSADQGGLGFDYKWDLGWMHDTLSYFQSPPWERKEKYHRLTFSMMYYYNEKYLLPFSHDEVVHGKATILQKMSGQYEEKFPQGRALYLYMMVHPGKKLNFMGNEIGQLREWDEKRQQDWELLVYPNHDSFYHYMAELNRLYLKHPALFMEDYGQEGFQWLDCHQEERCIYAILRRGGTERLAAIFNFSGTEQSYEMKLPEGIRAKLLLYSDWQRFGGNTLEKKPRWQKADRTWSLAPFCGMLLELKNEAENQTSLL